jgi:hypothetical protein
MHRTPKHSSQKKSLLSKDKRDFSWRSERDLNLAGHLLSLTKVRCLPQNTVEPEHLLTAFNRLKPPITIPIRVKIRENFNISA